jgi:hypothetical protein
MLVAWIVAFTEERSGLFSSYWMMPSKSEKRPRTFVSRCRTWNVASE